MTEVPEEPQRDLSPIEEGPTRRPTGAESTPGGVAAPLGTETYETQPLPALDALLQTNFIEDLEVKGLKSLEPHAEQHEPMGDDYIMALGEVENPVTKEKGRDLSEAQYLIDTIDMLRLKTQGNLSSEEEGYLSSLLNDLRMRYVDTAGQPAKEGQDKPQ